MGLSTCKPSDAWNGHGPHRRHDRRQAPPDLRRRSARVVCLLILLLWPFGAAAERFRVATFNVELSRAGPGLLLRDILSGEDPQVLAAAAVIARVNPDILLLTGFDFDAGSAAISAFAAELGSRGAVYPHSFTARPNAGMMTRLDLDGDGRLGGPGDAQGFGRFAGEDGMAILSRMPIDHAHVTDFSGLLWRDLPDANLPTVAGAPFPSQAAQDVQRLSSVAHWVVPVHLGDGVVMRLLAFHASPPVFDGPEDRNGLRNHDEAAFWLQYLAGGFGDTSGPLILLGDPNMDPQDSEGRPEALQALLDHPRLADPRPRSGGGPEASARQGGRNDGHRTDPALDTADWPDENGPGNLRVDYVLPSTEFRVVDAGVFWPANDDPDHELLGSEGNLASRHRLVWTDLELQH